MLLGEGQGLGSPDLGKENDSSLHPFHEGVEVS